MECKLCFEQTSMKKIRIHHVSYFPVIVENICVDCHSIIHDNFDEFTGCWIQYTYGDSGKYYQSNNYQDNWTLNGGYESWKQKKQKRELEDGKLINCPECKEVRQHSKWYDVFGMCNQCVSVIKIQTESYEGTTGRTVYDLRIPRKMGCDMPIFLNHLQNLIVNYWVKNSLTKEGEQN